MYKHQKLKRATALILSAFMVASSAQTGMLAESLEETERGSVSSVDETGTGSISTGAETEGSVSAPAVEQEPEYTSEIYTIALDLRSSAGVVTFNEGSAEEQTVSISKNENNETVSSVVNASGDLLKQYLVTDESPYSVIWTEGRGSKVNIKAVANDGYTVSAYESYVMNDDATGYVIQDIGFAKDTYLTFDCTVTADTNRVIAVDFAQTRKARKEEAAEDDIEIEPIQTPSTDAPSAEEGREEAQASMTETQEESEAAPAEEAAGSEAVSADQETEPAAEDTSNAEAPEEEIAISEESGDVLQEEKTEAEPTEDILVEESPSEETAAEGMTESAEVKESESILPETEEAAEEATVETEADAEEETEGILPEEAMTEAEETVATVEETEAEADTFSDVDTDYSFDADFSSMRLVVLASDSSDIIDPEHVIGNYGEIYLLQYKSVQQTKAAYAYYIEAADAVEPDSVVETASDDENSGEYTETDNPVSNLEDAADIPVSTTALVIALLDTGARESANIIGRVSLIDDQLSGSSHGEAMVSAILSQNPAAQILSVRVMDDAGKGTIASIVSGIEYAIEQSVSIINLSIYGKNTIANTVLEEEINKAVSAGIIVVGAAGNDGTNVSGYVPGRIDSAYILGACDEDGEKISSSNYGATVDYYAVADNTSTASALFSGYISAYGIDSIDGSGPVFFDPGYSGYGQYAEEDETEEDVWEYETEEDLEEYETEEDFEEEKTEEDEAPAVSRPTNASEVHFYESFWYRDKYYEFTAYNPYPDDKYVATTFQSGDAVDFEAVQSGDTFEMHYRHTAADEEDYSWTSVVEFTAEQNLSDATVKSEYADRILPSWIPQSGSTLPLPELAGTTINGMKYTVPQGTEDFSIYKIYNGYDVSRFRTTVDEDGGFDINTVGTYEVTYSVSYFLAPDYKWYVKSIIEVVPAQDDANTIRNTSDSIKVTLNGETDVPYAVPVQLEDTEFTVTVSGWNTNILNPISPSVTIKTKDDEDVTEKADISEEEAEDGSVVYRISLPEDTAALTVYVKDEANEVLFEAKDSYAGYWRIIDSESLGLEYITEEDLSELETYYYSDEYAETSEDPNLEDLGIAEEDEDGTFRVAGYTDWLFSKTWKNASSSKLYKGKVVKADWNGGSYVGSRYTLRKALANKVKAYVAEECNDTYWSDTLQTKFDSALQQYQDNYIFIMHCCATRAEHKKINYYGWQESDKDSTLAHFLKIVKGSNRPYLTVSGRYNETTNSDGTTTHTWQFKFSGKVNPKSAKYLGYTRQPHGGSFKITITDSTEAGPRDFTVKKVNAAYALDEDTAFPMNLKAYQDLSATFYVCTDPSNPKGSVVDGGVLKTDDDGTCDDVVEDLQYDTTYYCWEDPSSTKNYTATTNPVEFTIPAPSDSSSIDPYVLTFPNDPVPMNIKLKKESSNPGLTSGNSMYSLANIPFTIYGAGQGLVRSPKTNANGEWTETGLWKDTYYVQEAGQATGYKTSSSKLTVTPTDGTEELTYSLTFKNEPLYFVPEILLKKEPTNSKTNNASLAGAIFRIDYYDRVPRMEKTDEVTNMINNYTPTKSWQETTNANGEVKVTNSPYTDPNNSANNNHIIPLGTVVCTELTAPTNGRYYINSAKVIATFTQSGNTVVPKYYLLSDDGSFTPGS